MIKKTFTYTNTEGNTVKEDAYFHIGKLDAMKLADQPWFQNMQNLSKPDVKVSVTETIDIVSNLIRTAYGRRVINENGVERFIKNEDEAKAFVESEVGEDFIFSLITNSDSMTEFITGIFPSSINDTIKHSLEESKALEENKALENLEKTADVAELFKSDTIIE